MNAFLLSIGIALALLLSAALAVPLFVDWDAYRGVIEEQAAGIVGRPVAIDGHVEVRLVPFPVIRASDVRIGGEGSREGVAALSARGGLMPLLSGEIHLSELTLERPELHFSVSPDGFVAWGVETEPATIPIPPERVRVDGFEIRDGRIVIEDARSERNYVAEGLDLTGTASSLAGPYKFDGTGTVEGRRYGLRVALGRTQPDGTIRVGATVEPEQRPVVLTLDGTLGYSDGQPRYRGSLAVENVVAPPAEDAEKAEVSEPADVRRWRFEAATVATAESVVFEDLGLRVGEAEHPIALSGAAQIELGRQARFQAVLSSRQIDVDRALGGGPESPVPPQAAVAALSKLIAPDLVPIDGRLSVDIGSLVVGGNIVEALGAELVFEGGNWRIGRADAVLPGKTDVALSGRVYPDQEAPRFEGAVTVVSEHASPLAAWLFGQEAHLPGLGAVTGSLRASSSIRLERTGFALDRLEVKTDRNALSGSIAYTAPGDGDPHLDIALRTDQLDIRGLPLDRLGDAIRGRLPGDGGKGGMDLSLDLDAGELVGPTMAARKVRAQGLMTGETLRIDRLEIGDIAGFEVAANGELDNLGGAPTGKIDLRVSSDDLVAAARTAEALGYAGLAGVIDRRRETLSPAAATLAISSREEGGQAGLDLKLDGTLGGSAISGKARIEGRLDELATAPLQLDLEATNADSAALFAQLGLLTLPGQRGGSATLSASGLVRDGVAFEIAGEGLPVSGTIAGNVAWPETGPLALDADLALRLRDVAMFLDPLGLSALVEPTDSGSLRAHLAGRGTRYELSDVAYDGVTQLAGHLVLETDGAPRLSGALRADELSLDRVVTGSAGVDEFLIQRGDGPVGWSEQPFLMKEIAPWSLALNLAAPEASWKGLSLSDLSFDLVSDGDGFAFRNLAARMWDGALEGAVELETLRGALNLTARLKLADAAMGRFLWQEQGAPVATGRLDLTLDLSGAGRTPRALVASLAGEGSFTARDGTIRRMNPAAFASVLAAVEAGLPVEEEPVAALFGRELDRGALAFRSVQGAIAANEGSLRVGRVKFDAADLAVFASGSVELPELSLESDWTLRAGETGEARAREASLSFDGPIAAPSRRLGVAPLLSHLTVRRFETEMERLEDLQSEILERERLGRELMQLGRERRQRERGGEATEGQGAATPAEAEPQAAPDTAGDNPDASGEAGDNAASAPAQPEDGTISLDREEFRRTIQDLLRGVDGTGDRSGSVEPKPRARAEAPIRGSLPATAARRGPLNIQPGIQ